MQKGPDRFGSKFQEILILLPNINVSKRPYPSHALSRSVCLGQGWDRQTYRPTIRLLELLGASKNCLSVEGSWDLPLLTWLWCIKKKLYGVYRVKSAKALFPWYIWAIRTTWTHLLFILTDFSLLSIWAQFGPETTVRSQEGPTQSGVTFFHWINKRTK